MPFPIIAAASLASKIGGGLLANKKDPQRIATAQANLTKALAGDMQALAALQAQAAGSATEVGKNAARSALASYAARQPTFTAPPSATPLQQQVADTVAQIRQDVASGVQNIGAGASTAAANAIGGQQTNAITLPVKLTDTHLMLLGAAAVLLILFRR